MEVTNCTYLQQNMQRLRTCKGQRQLLKISGHNVSLFSQDSMNTRGVRKVVLQSGYRTTHPDFIQDIKSVLQGTVSYLIEYEPLGQVPQIQHKQS